MAQRLKIQRLRNEMDDLRTSDGRFYFDVDDAGTRTIGFGGGDSGEDGSGTFTRGLNVRLTSGNTGSPSVGEIAYNRIFIDADTADATTGGGSKCDGVMIQHEFGNSSTKGGRHAVEARLFQDGATSGTNTDRNYVASVGWVQSATGDGGSGGSEKGAYFAFNGFARLTSGATSTYNLTGAEFNALCMTGASTLYRSGIQIAGGGDVRGSTHDCAIGIGNLGAATTTWKTGIKFHTVHGDDPFGADSTVLHVTAPTSIDKLIDCTGISFTGNIMKTATVDWTDTEFSFTGSFHNSSGTATPAGGSTAARLLFGTTAGFGIYYGSGAPSVSAAKGSLYLRSDGSGTTNRMYVNTDGGTTWTAVTTSA
jgi:hypothetical protein